MQTGTEHYRRAKRISVRIPASMKAGERAHEVVVVNLGEGGLGLTIDSARAPIVGERVVVELRLPRQPTVLSLPAQVAWVMPGVREVEVGLRFVDASGADQEAVLRFLDGFRARVASVGPVLDSELRASLRDVCELEELTLDALPTSMADGLLNLVVVHGSAEVLETVLRDTESLSIPVVLLQDGLPDERVLELLRRHSRVVVHRLPTRPELFAAELRRTLVAHALGIENERLAFELDSATATVRSPHERVANTVAGRLAGVIGVSEAMQKVYAQLDRISRVDASVVLLGETGTGKGLLAKVIHEQSPRARRPMVTQNCAALSEALLDSELFGHVRGAFTGAVSDRAGLFEVANGGTVFLDEIAEMSPGMQAKLLHVLQDGELRRVGSTAPTRVDVRVLCATHADLAKRVEARTFREDLYYRLLSFIVKLPPLRERVPDIIPLARHFLLQFTTRNRLPLPKFTAEAERALEQAPWPGNVRQLQHLVERLALMAPDAGNIDAALVSEALGPVTPLPTSGVLGDTLEAQERVLIQGALDDADGVIADAARVLGMERSTLSRRVKKLGLRARGGSR